MGIFDMFMGGNSQQQQQPVPGNMQAPGSQQQDNSAAGVIPGAQATSEEGKTADPLANFANLWEPVSNKDDSASLADFRLDPTKLQEVVSKASFTGTVTPDHLRAIANGGEDAVKAFQDSLNSVAQNVMMQATLAANKMTEQMVSKALAAQEAKFPKLIKQHNTAEQLSAANPLFSNPAVKPILEAVQYQLQAKNPNASASEIVAMSQDFVRVLSEQLGNKQTASSPQDSNEMDWSKFF